MRHVFENEMVAHLWATQAQSEARNPQGNFYFRGDTIYSYGGHFPIARLLGDGTILFTTRGYSNTTAGHIRDARGALSQDQQRRVVEVANVKANSASEHADNYAAMADDFRSLLQRASTARTRKADLLNEAERVRRAAAEYRKTFCKGQLKRCKPLPNIANLEAMLAEFKAERERAENKARKDKQRTLELWLKYGLPAWKRGESSVIIPAGESLPENMRTTPVGKGKHETSTKPPADAPVDFRLTDDGATVQTTLGACFPRRHCERAFKAVERCRKAATTWERNGQQIHVGLFQIDRIDEQGNVVAGCHRVQWNEIHAFAVELGISK